MSHDTRSILAAAVYAAEKHATQKRKVAAGEPYVNHLIEVAFLVSTALSEPDANLVTAAFLHDVVEDAGITAAELTERFGQDVTDLVLEVTDGKSLPKEEHKRLQIEHAPKLSVRAQTIKLADKISNLRSILTSPPTNWDFKHKREYFDWAKRVVDGFTTPNPLLMAEFESTFERFDEVQGGKATPRTKDRPERVVLPSAGHTVGPSAGIERSIQRYEPKDDLGATGVTNC